MGNFGNVILDHSSLIGYRVSTCIYAKQGSIFRERRGEGRKGRMERERERERREGERATKDIERDRKKEGGRERERERQVHDRE